MDDQLDRVIEQVCKDSDMPLPVSESVHTSIIYSFITEVEGVFSISNGINASAIKHLHYE